MPTRKGPRRGWPANSGPRASVDQQGQRDRAGGDLAGLALPARRARRPATEAAAGGDQPRRPPAPAGRGRLAANSTSQARLEATQPSDRRGSHRRQAASPRARPAAPARNPGQRPRARP